MVLNSIAFLSLIRINIYKDQSTLKFIFNIYIRLSKLYSSIKNYNSRLIRNSINLSRCLNIIKSCRCNSNYLIWILFYKFSSYCNCTTTVCHQILLSYIWIAIPKFYITKYFTLIITPESAYAEKSITFITIL